MLNMYSFNLPLLLAVVGLTTLAGCKVKADAPEGHPTEAVELPLVRTRSYRILALGDSITRGSSEALGNYRRPLQALLSQGGYKFEFVGTNTEQSDNYHGTDTGQTFTPYQPLHEGYGGFRIEQIGSENQNKDDGGVAYPGLSVALEKANPDVVLMMLGTNDVNQGFDPAGSTGYAGQTGFGADAAARMDALVTRIQELKPNAALVLATITPLRNRERQEKAQSYNGFIKQIVEAHRAKGEHIVLADMGEELGTNDLAGDGVHPSTAGYNKMARVWFEALTREKTATTTADKGNGGQ